MVKPRESMRILHRLPWPRSPVPGCAVVGFCQLMALLQRYLALFGMAMAASLSFTSG